MIHEKLKGYWIKIRALHDLTEQILRFPIFLKQLNDIYIYIYIYIYLYKYNTFYHLYDVFILNMRALILLH